MASEILDSTKISLSDINVSLIDPGAWFYSCYWNPTCYNCHAVPPFNAEAIVNAFVDSKKNRAMDIEQQLNLQKKSLLIQADYVRLIKLLIDKVNKIGINTISLK